MSAKATIPGGGISEVQEKVSEDAPVDRGKKSQTMVNSVVQALSILRFLARSGESQGVTSIARQLGMNPSSVFNIVKTLTAENFLNFNETQKRYALGPGALELADVALDNKKAFDRVRDLLEDIVTQFLVTGAFWRLTNDERVVLVGLVESKEMMRIQMTIGQRIPAFSGAMGRCYASTQKFRDDALRRRFESVRWQEAPHFATFLADMRESRKRGWAIDRGQFIRGVTTIAAPVKDATGRIQFFIVNSSFVGQLPEERLQALGEASRTASVEAAELLFG